MESNKDVISLVWSSLIIIFSIFLIIISIFIGAIIGMVAGPVICMKFLHSEKSSNKVDDII
jgi:uncharacterized membrane protein SpoIIM required for sporulation